MTKLEIKDRIITALAKLQGEILSKVDSIDKEMDISTVNDVKVKVDLQFIVGDLGPLPAKDK
jgi:hypothetical protein